MRDTKNKYEILLNTAAVIFGAISVYYTAEGFMIILGADSAIKVLFAWGFALGISMILVYCSLSVALFLKQGKGLLLSIIFLVFAIISLFFNFNSIYGDFTKEDLASTDVNRYVNIMTEIDTKSSELLDSTFGLSKSKKTLDSLKLEKNREARDSYRPGQGTRWRTIDRQIPTAESHYNIAREKYENSRENLDSLKAAFQRSADKAILQPNKENAERTVHQLNLYGSALAAICPVFKYEREEFTNNSGEPDFALRFLGRLFTFDSSLTSKEVAYGALSMFVGSVIDFPVFFAMILLRWPKNNKKGENDLFGEKRTGDRTGRQKRGARNKRGKIIW